MKYDEHRAKFGENYNPFKDIPEKFMIDKNDLAFIIANRGPYTVDHLLVIPFREVNNITELTKEEKVAFFDLLAKRLKKLEKKYQGVNILIRDGYFKKGGGKSVNHLHAHLIPEIAITSQSADGRKFLSEEEFLAFTEKIQKEYGDKD